MCRALLNSKWSSLSSTYIGPGESNESMLCEGGGLPTRNQVTLTDLGTGYYQGDSGRRNPSVIPRIPIRWTLVVKWKVSRRSQSS